MLHKRRRLLLGLVAALTAALVIWVVTPKARFIYGLSPISPDEAVLLTRHNGKDATYFFVQLMRTDGSVSWSVDVTPFETHEALGFSGIAASEDRVVLLGQRENDITVMARSRATGELLWETKLASQATLHRIGPMLLVDPPRIHVHYERSFDEKTTAEALTTLALADGAVLWNYEPSGDERRPGGLDVALLGAASLLVGTRSSLLEIDGATGKVHRELPKSRFRCETPAGIIGTWGREVILVPRATADGGQAAVRRMDLGVLRADTFGPCGLRGEDLILATMKDEGDDHRIGLARIDLSRGEVRFDLQLKGSLFGEFRTVDGRLPRFLPVSVFRTEVDAKEKEVVVVDVDEGTILGHHSVRDHMIPFVTAERAFVMGPFTRTILALDPATGALESATRLKGLGIHDVRREDLRFGSFWAAGTGWARPASLSWVIFDLATGKLARTNGELVPMDVTAEGWSGNL